MEPLNEGQEVTSLPCTSGGCSSVWHSQCVRKWLCQGQQQTCPLCRTVFDSGMAPPPSMSFALEFREAGGLIGMMARGNNNIPAGLPPELIQDFIFLALLPHSEGQIVESTQGAGDTPASMPSRLLRSGFAQMLRHAPSPPRPSAPLNGGTGVFKRLKAVAATLQRFMFPGGLGSCGCCHCLPW